MDIDNGAAEAAAAEELQPEVQEQATSEPAQVEDSGPRSVRDSLQGAFDTVDKASEDANRPRDEQGRFIPKQAEAEKPVEVSAEKPVEAPVAPEAVKPVTPVDDAPARFSADAKAAWATAPESVRGEVRRAITELESGLQQKSAQLQQYQPIEPFMAMAHQSGTTLDQALSRYVNLENTLRADPLRGIEAVLANVGMTPAQYAQMAGYTQQPQIDPNTGMAMPQQGPDPQTQHLIYSLRQEIEQLKQAQNSFTMTLQQREQMEVERQLAEFSKDKPRFNELRKTMGELMDSGMANDLGEAYEKADRLNPGAAPVVAPPVAQAAPVQPPANIAAQTRKGSLSVAGAPASGSNPATRPASKSVRDSLAFAMSQAGVAS